MPLARRNFGPNVPQTPKHPENVLKNLWEAVPTSVVRMLIEGLVTNSRTSEPSLLLFSCQIPCFEPIQLWYE